MIDRKLRWLMWLSMSAALFAGLVLLLESYFRLTKVGSICPVWLGCYSSFVKGTHQAWIRILYDCSVSILTALVFTVIVLGITCAKRYGGNYLRISILLMLLVTYQLILEEVKFFNELPFFITQYLLSSMLMIAFLWLLYLRCKSYLKRGIESRAFFAKGPVMLGLVLVFIQATLGIWTSANGTASSCPDFPFCFFSISQHLDFRAAFNVLSSTGLHYQSGQLSQITLQTIQMTHRLGALVVAGYLLLLAIYLLSKEKKNNNLHVVVWQMLCLLFAEIGLGVLNELFNMPLLSVLLHSLIAVLLVCALVSIIFYVSRARRYYKARLLYQ